MKKSSSILEQILVDVRKELAAAQHNRPLSELKARMKDAPPVRSLATALRAGFGLVAEIKERSPSHGPMRRENVDLAPAAYEHCSLVHGISVLTNASHFGMDMHRLRAVKIATTKPVLRKDFIFDEYQVYEARAFGADAILLMANLLEPSEMRKLYAVARELEMDALFECHNREQIAQTPEDAIIYGINSRTFDARKNTLGVGRYAVSAMLGRLGSAKDLTIDEGRFELGQFLPPAAIKVAESGVYPETAAVLRDRLGYHAALVGTSLLSAARGIDEELHRFEEALRASNAPKAVDSPAPSGGGV
ncbi:MAG: indole-3-glycerol-phosphate synthase [Verrucomicrobiia bacterium]